jgi:hypothetical protein
MTLPLPSKSGALPLSYSRSCQESNLDLPLFAELPVPNREEAVPPTPRAPVYQLTRLCGLRVMGMNRQSRGSPHERLHLGKRPGIHHRDLSDRRGKVGLVVGEEPIGTAGHSGREMHGVGSTKPIGGP